MRSLRRGERARRRSSRPPSLPRSRPLRRSPRRSSARRRRLRSSRTRRGGRSSRRTSRGSSAAAPKGEGAAQGSQGAAGPAAQGGTGANPMARLLLLPDLSAVGSFAGAFDSYDVERLSPREGPFGPKDKPTPLFQELELALQSVIDPYARADIFISFTPDEVAVEEAVLHDAEPPRGTPGPRREVLQPLRPAEPAAPARLGVRGRSARARPARRRGGAVRAGRGRRLARPAAVVRRAAPRGAGDRPGGERGGSGRAAHRRRPPAAVLPPRRADHARPRDLRGAAERGDRRVPRSRRRRPVPPLASARARGRTWRSRARSSAGGSARPACRTRSGRRCRS